MVHGGVASLYGTKGVSVGWVLGVGVKAKLTVFWEQLKYFEGTSYSIDYGFTVLGADVGGSLIYFKNDKGKIEKGGFSVEFGASLDIPIDFDLSVSKTNTWIFHRQDIWPSDKDIELKIKELTNNEEVTGSDKTVPNGKPISGERYFIQVSANKKEADMEKLTEKFPSANIFMKEDGGYNKYFIGIPFKTYSEAEKYKTILKSSCTFEQNDMPFIVKFSN